jgi:hypothetical protein
MDRQINETAIAYMSDADEDFLLADIHIGGVPCCQVLKRDESGPVLLAFFRPDTKEEVLTDLDSFVDALRTAAKEIEAIKRDRST